VQALRELADQRKEGSSLEIELESYIRQQIQDRELTAKDAAAIMVTIQRRRSGESGGPSALLTAILQNQ
jgi:hypothetical protein